MPKIPDPPEYVRADFRQQLIERGGGTGFSPYGPKEELRRFRFYLDTFEKFISDQEAAEITVLDAEAKSLSEEARGEFWSDYYPVHWDEIFRETLRSSFLISLISFVEVTLVQLCRDVEVIANAPLSANDIKGTILERSQVFLRPFGGFTAPSDDQWTTLSRIYDVRNVQVHNGGALYASRHEARITQFANSVAGLVETHGHLEVKPEFVSFTLNSIDQFLGSLLTQLEELCRRVQSSEKSAKAP